MRRGSHVTFLNHAIVCLLQEQDAEWQRKHHAVVAAQVCVCVCVYVRLCDCVAAQVPRGGGGAGVLT